MAEFPLADFREIYPQFDLVSDTVVNSMAAQAECLIDQHGCDCEAAMWMLMVAHLLQLRAEESSGSSAPGPLASATVGGVSVSFHAPPYGTSAYKFWLSGTPFGSQLLAMLSRCSAGGIYVGGLPERAAFRSVAGYFPGGRRWLR